MRHTSGLEVDIFVDDFEAWYPQFPLAAMEHYLNTQIVCSDGAESNPRPNFGGMYLPVKSTRANYTVCELIEIRLWEVQNTMDWTPWHPSVREKAEHFGTQRRAVGGSGAFFSQFPWFDDNSMATLRVIGVRAREARYKVWKELVWIVESSKAAVNTFGAENQAPIVGLILKLKERRLILPMAGIDAIVQMAKTHPQFMVVSDMVDTLLGQLIHATEAYPELWQWFMLLIVQLSTGRRRTRTVMLPSTQDLLLKIKHTMQTSPGRPLTSYRRTPGADGLPVWVSYTDASRNTKTYFGAVGGWFYAWDSPVVFFFCKEWSTAEVERSNIGDMELAGANVAAVLQSQVAKCHHSHGLQYLFQYGDNEAVFKHVLNSTQARSSGMRTLTAARVRHEESVQRLLGACHIMREFNTAADALANMDVELFEYLVGKIKPNSALCRLAVPEEWMVLP